VRVFPAVLAGVLALSALSACKGDDRASANPPSKAAFKDHVAAAIISGTDLQADPGFGVAVDVSQKDGFNTLTLRLDKELADYNAHPDRRQAIVDQIVQRVKARMQGGNAEESLASVRAKILPLLKPQAALRRVTPVPVSSPFPANLLVTYGVQEKDSFFAITQADANRWKTTPRALFGLATSNLERETNREQRLLCEEKLCGWASGDGYDAARMLVPALRQQIVRKIGPAVYAVPRESVFIALPIKLADRIRSTVVRQFVTAPNPVSSDVFVERDGELVVLPK
jgi:uncharacterized protein YtpQ (UPF0354 family)